MVSPSVCLFAGVGQSGTAAYDALYINPTITSLGDGSTGDGNNLLNLSSNGTVRMVVDLGGQVGIGTATPVAPLTVNGATVVTGLVTATSVVCGQLYLDGTDEQNLGASYQILSNMTTTALNNMTGTESNLTATLAGTYMLQFQVSAQLGANEAIEVALFNGTNELDNIEAQASTPATGTDRVSCSAVGLVTLAANDVLYLKAKSLDAAADFDPEKIQVVAHRLN